MRGGLSIVVMRKPKVDKLKPTSGPAQRTVITNCVVLPSQTYDSQRGIWVTVDGYDVHCLAPGAEPGDVLEDDQVEYDGKLWQVYGAPAVYRNGRGQLKDIVVKIRRVA